MILAGGRFKATKGGSSSFTLELGCGTPCCRSLLQVYNGKVGKCMGGNPLRGNNYIETISELQMLKGCGGTKGGEHDICLLCYTLALTFTFVLSETRNRARGMCRLTLCSHS